MPKIMPQTVWHQGKRPTTSPISAVARTMAILELISERPKGAGVTALASRLGIGKSTVSRVLSTLEDNGYVVRDPISLTYQVSLRFCGLALRRVDAEELYELCMPLLQGLAERTGETVQVALVEGEEMTYVAKADGPQRLRVLSLLGYQAVLHASAAGKVWLASLPEERALEIVLKAGLEQYTENTITTVRHFQAELEKVRLRGYATVESELLPGVAAVAVAIKRPADDAVIGAILISGPVVRMPKKRLGSFVNELRTVAEELKDLDQLAARWAPKPVDESEAISKSA